MQRTNGERRLVPLSDACALVASARVASALFSFAANAIHFPSILSFWVSNRCLTSGTEHRTDILLLHLPLTGNHTRHGNNSRTNKRGQEITQRLHQDIVPISTCSRHSCKSFLPTPVNFNNQSSSFTFQCDTGPILDIRPQVLSSHGPLCSPRNRHFKETCRRRTRRGYGGRGQDNLQQLRQQPFITQHFLSTVS